MKPSNERNAILKASVGLALVGVLALSACARDDPAEFDEGDSQAASDTETTDTDSADAESQGADSEGADSEDANDDQDSGSSPETSPGVNPDDALETVTYPIPSDSIDGELTVGFHHLRVEGQTMELLLTYTPEFTGNDAHSLWQLHGNNHASVAPHLYDRENLKRYSILESGAGYGEGHWATPQADVSIASGETQAYWATFAAPEDDITTINVGLPVGPEFKDVDIDSGDANSGDAETGEADDAEADGTEDDDS